MRLRYLPLLALPLAACQPVADAAPPASAPSSAVDVAPAPAQSFVEAFHVRWPNAAESDAALAQWSAAMCAELDAGNTPAALRSVIDGYATDPASADLLWEATKLAVSIDCPQHTLS